MKLTQKITPFLWFDTQAKEAVDFYLSLFPGSKIVSTQALPDGNVLSIHFDLAGQSLCAFNAGPHFKFNEAISLYVDCKSQEEVDSLWSRILAHGGTEQQCGWIKDRYGLSWQIVPDALPRLLYDHDRQKAQRVVDAMMQMVKLDAAKLQAAYDGK